MKFYRLTALPICVLWMLMTAGCNKTVVMDLNRPESNVVAQNTISNDSADPFQNFYSFHFKINEDPLFLFMTYAQLLDQGWTCGLTGEESILGSLGVPDVVFSKGDDLFAGTLASTNAFYVNASELLLTSVTFSSELSPDSSVELPKNVMMKEESKDSLKEKIGEPQDIAELSEEQGTLWFYSYDIDETISFTFNQEDKIEEITMARYVKNQPRTQVPEEIKNYVRADKLSDDLRDQTFELDGIVYKMPIPVKQWMENGYLVQKAYTPLPGSKMLEPGDTTGCNLVNGNAELYAIIENYGLKAQTFDKCYVTRLTLSPMEGHTIKLSPRFSFDTPPEELLGILNTYENIQDTNEYFSSVTIPIAPRSTTAFYTDTATGEMGLVEYMNYPE